MLCFVEFRVGAGAFELEGGRGFEALRMCFVVLAIGAVIRGVVDVCAVEKCQRELD